VKWEPGDVKVQFFGRGGTIVNGGLEAAPPVRIPQGHEVQGCRNEINVRGDLWGGEHGLLSASPTEKLRV